MTTPVLDDQTAPSADQASDPEAPWGRKPDGTPYKRDPAATAASLSAARDARWKNTGGAKKTAAPKAPGARRTPNRPAGPPPKDYATAILGVLQIPAAGLAVAGQVTRNEALAADAAAITLHGPGLAQALADLAAADERIAALLDKITAVGPYSALIAAVVPLALQIAVNHRDVDPPQALTAATGVLSRHDLMAKVLGPVGQTEAA